MQHTTHPDAAKPDANQPHSSEPATTGDSPQSPIHSASDNADLDQWIHTLTAEPRHELELRLSAPPYLRLLDPTPRFASALLYLPAPRVWPDAQWHPREQARRIDTALADPVRALESWLNSVKRDGAPQAVVNFLSAMRMRMRMRGDHASEGKQ